MATSTYMTFLMHKKETAWEKLLDITEFPDLGGDPELIGKLAEMYNDPIVTLMEEPDEKAVKNVSWEANW